MKKVVVKWRTEESYMIWAATCELLLVLSCNLSRATTCELLLVLSCKLVSCYLSLAATGELLHVLSCNLWAATCPGVSGARVTFRYLWATWLCSRWRPQAPSARCSTALKKCFFLNKLIFDVATTETSESTLSECRNKYGLRKTLLSIM